MDCIGNIKGIAKEDVGGSLNMGTIGDNQKTHKTDFLGSGLMGAIGQNKANLFHQIKII